MNWSVNLAGLGLGGPHDGYFEHGVYGANYKENSAEELDYYKAKGMDYFRLQFEWYRVQHTLNGPLDPDDIAHLDNVVDAAAARGLHVSICPFDYARYYDASDNGAHYWDGGIGSEYVPLSAFVDFWTKIATHFRDRTNKPWAYDLMNEPEGCNIWGEAAVAAIQAIRATGGSNATIPIIYPCPYWSTARTWYDYSPAHDVVLAYQAEANDPNIIYEAHLYLDPNMSGAYGEDTVQGGWDGYTGTPEDRGAWCLEPFVSWLRENGKVGLIGEFNTTATPFWLNVLDHACAYIQANGDVLQYIQLQTSWPEGWEGYGMDLRPVNGVEAGQWAVLNNYVGGDVSTQTVYVTIRLTPIDYAAEFTVLNDVTSAPVQGASITCEGQTAASGADGKATISGLSAGNHAVGVTATGFDNYSGSFTS